MYALIEDNVVKELFDTLPVFHPDVMSMLHETSGGVEVGWIEDVDGDLVPPAAGFNIWDKQAGDYVLDVDGWTSQVRKKRDEKLAGCDFRMISDAPWDIAPWIAYRTALRDLPDAAGFPWTPESVEWPVEP